MLSALKYAGDKIYIYWQNKLLLGFVRGYVCAYNAYMRTRIHVLMTL